MLSFNETKNLVSQLLKKPEALSQLVSNYGEFFISVDTHLKGLNLTPQQIETLATKVYTKHALQNSPLKDKLTPNKLEQLGILASTYPMLNGVLAEGGGKPLWCLYPTLAEVLEADFKTAEKKFVDQNIPKSEVQEAFKLFKDLKNKIQKAEERDIDQWAKGTWQEFQTFLEAMKEKKSGKEIKKQEKLEGADLVAENEEWKVYKILTHEACMHYGRNTKWCITGKDGKYWSKYNRDNNFYFFIRKEPIGDANDKIAMIIDTEGEKAYFNEINKEIDIVNSINFPEFKVNIAELKPLPEEEFKRLVRVIKDGIEEHSEDINVPASDFFYDWYDDAWDDPNTGLNSFTGKKIKSLIEEARSKGISNKAIFNELKNNSKIETCFDFDEIPEEFLISEAADAVEFEVEELDYLPPIDISSLEISTGVRIDGERVSLCMGDAIYYAIPDFPATRKALGLGVDNESQQLEV